MMPEPSRQVTAPYGDRMVRAQLPCGRCLGTLDIAPIDELTTPERSIRAALDRPIGLDRGLFEIVQPGESVVILVSDSFRQTRADVFLPTLIEGLVHSGTREEDLSILFSTGTHRAPTPEEQREILSAEIFDRLAGRIHVHDPYDAPNHVFLGTTSRGTPVEINRRVHEADRVIVTGSVVLHYFGGFGGGRKSVVPGVASARTIAHNHAMNLHPDEDRLDPRVSIGTLDGNPVAEDMLEATRMTHVDCILNTVLNREGDIAGVFAGELEAAHQEACAFARSLFEVPIKEKADLVIAASPTTKNFVQTHKALFNAHQALKPTGRIVLLAPCPEGLGDDQFTKWLALGDRSQIIAALRDRSEINGQTALSTREKAPLTWLVTDLSEKDIAQLGAHKADSFQEALDQACAELAHAGIEDPTYYLMPSAAYTVPKPSQQP